jgi:hypothetical protein
LRGLAVRILAVVAVEMLVAVAVAAASPWLVSRDPGARVGAHTLVVHGAGESVRGLSGRPNFIIGLGADETIQGAHASDQLGAFGQGDVLVAGKAGHHALAGAEGTVIVSGAGHDLVFTQKPNVTVRLDSPADRVVLAGHNDRVVCTDHAKNERIYRGASDPVAGSCAGQHNQTLPLNRWPKPTQSSRRLSAQADWAKPNGDGSNEHPYRRPCPHGNEDGLFAGVCAIEFPPRTLTGLWANEYVPAYACPYVWLGSGWRQTVLENVNYAPGGTTLPPGVEVRGLGPIGVSITSTNGNYLPYYYYRTFTGYPNSSATNWTLGSASYQVVLHCYV